MAPTLKKWSLASKIYLPAVTTSMVFARETPIDRYILTSRGYELAAIVFDGFYDLLSSNAVPFDERLGAFVRAEKRETVLQYWAEQFTLKGAAVVQK